MDLHTLGLFVLTETLLCLSPGPAVILVIGLSIRNGFRVGVGATLGILFTNAIYFTLAALGVGGLIIASATLFNLIKWAGAIYLAWLGLQMLRPLLARLRHGPPAAVEALPDHGPQERQSFAGAFRRGAVLQAANPKNIVFFVAILPQFIAPEGPVALQLAVLGLTSVSLELPILLVYGFATSRAAALMTERVVEALEGAAGGILIALGAALALYRRAA